MAHSQDAEVLHLDVKDAERYGGNYIRINAHMTISGDEQFVIGTGLYEGNLIPGPMTPFSTLEEALADVRAGMARQRLDRYAILVVSGLPPI